MTDQETGTESDHKESDQLKAEAKELITSWHKAHPVVEEVRVVDGETTWDYFIDIGDKSEVEKGKGKKADASSIEPKKVHDEFATKSGEEHKIYLRPLANDGFELIMESTPTLYIDFINAFKMPANPSEELVAIKQSALAVAQKLGQELDLLTKGTPPTMTTEDFDQQVNLLADYTKKLMDATMGPAIPKNEIVFGPSFDGAFGSSVAINYLSSKSGGEQSSSIPYAKHGILDLRKGESGKRPYYLRGHLLNANLHGPNDWTNLTPLTYSANSQHKTKVENELTKHLTPEGAPLTTDQRAFKYIVIAQYGRGVNASAKEQVDKSVDPEVQAYATTIKSIIDAEAFVPKHLQIKAFELKPNAKGEWTIETPIFNDSIPNEIEQTPGSYNVSGTEREIATKLPLGQVNLAFLKKWFNDENASAIDKAIRLNRGKITSFEILQSKTLEVLGSTDKRKIALSALENHITIP